VERNLSNSHWNSLCHKLSDPVFCGGRTRAQGNIVGPEAKPFNDYNNAILSQAFPLHAIASMDKVGRRKRTIGYDDYGIDFYLKDTRIVRFIFERESTVIPPPRRMVHTTIIKGYRDLSDPIPPMLLTTLFSWNSLIQPVTRLFAFHYFGSLQHTEPSPVNGWKIYDAEKEYQRLIDKELDTRISLY